MTIIFAIAIGFSLLCAVTLVSACIVAGRSHNDSSDTDDLGTVEEEGLHPRKPIAVHLGSA